MKVLDPGHYYSVNVYDGEDEQYIWFMHRIGEGYPGNQGEPYSGTNCQEVIRVLIDRVKYLNSQIPCEANIVIITNLREALWQFEQRAADRHGRQLPERPIEVEHIPTCVRCGHIHCGH